MLKRIALRFGAHKLHSLLRGVSRKFGEWYQKTNKTEDTNRLILFAFKIIAILHNTLLATVINLIPGSNLAPAFVFFLSITFLVHLTMTPTFVTLSLQVSSRSAYWFCAVGDNRFSKISIFPSMGSYLTPRGLPRLVFCI
jgi:hypothetical protein